MRRMLNGEIWLSNLNSGRGKEPGKVRPVLIVQGQALLDAKHPSTLIVPMNTQLTEDAEPLRLRVVAHGRLEADSDLLIDQLRAIDNRRLIDGPLLLCDSELMMRVYAAMRDTMEM